MRALMRLWFKSEFRLQLIFLAICALFLISVQAFGQESIVKEEGIVFCQHDGISLQMDIAYSSIANGAHPALVFISGSGWGHWWSYGFDRHQYSKAISNAAAHGYVAATVDIRPTSIQEGGKPKYTYPAQLIDVRSAVRWLRAYAEKYHIDSDHIGAIGWSSGGHLSLMLGLLDSDTELDETDILGFSSKVQAVVSLAGPTELSLMYNEATYPAIKSVLTELMGGTPEQLPVEYREASPIYHITSSAPPMLLIYSDNDTEVPLDQASLFADEMRSKNRTITLIIQKGMGHMNAYTHDSIFAFFDAVLKASD
jgi:acetyl esterase/lipase